MLAYQGDAQNHGASIVFKSPVESGSTGSKGIVLNVGYNGSKGTRLDIPAIVWYTGSIAPGLYRQREVSVGDVYEGIGAHAEGKMSDADLQQSLADHTLLLDLVLRGPLS